MLRCLSRRLQHIRFNHTFPAGQLDFDAWALSIDWPQEGPEVPPLASKCGVVVEDIKFAYNAWMLLRLCLFYGLRHPQILSSLCNTTPSMDIALRGNRLFWMHSVVGASLPDSDGDRSRVALTPSHRNAVSIDQFDWDAASSAGGKNGVQLVLGMENGMTSALEAKCDHHVFIPQYGSIGSLSMLSALAIAVHAAHSALHPVAVRARDCDSAPRAPLQSARQPKSNPTCSPTSGTTADARPKSSLPHEEDLQHLSNEEVRHRLAALRSRFKIELHVLIRNEIGDRNIGATIRNANVFNCNSVILFNRRKFSRRGTVGTHHYTPIVFCETVEDLHVGGVLRDTEVWLLHTYYPFLQNFFAASAHDASARNEGHTHGVSKRHKRLDGFQTYIRHEDSNLQRWMAEHNVLLPEHPMNPALKGFRAGSCDEAEEERVISLDDPNSVEHAVASCVRRGKRGIVLAFAEEGATPHPELCSVADKVLYAVNPKRLALRTQRGLNPALSSAVALHLVRSAIDRL